MAAKLSIRLFFTSFLIGASLGLSPFSEAKDINKQTLNEFQNNQQLRDCYSNSALGKEKKKIKVIVDAEVDAQGKITKWAANKKSPPAAAEIANCVLSEMKNLVIPFRSSERGQTVSIPLQFSSKK